MYTWQRPTRDINPFSFEDLMTTVEMPQAPAPVPPPQPRKRRWGRTLILSILVFAVIGVFGAIAAVLWTDSKIDKIPEEEMQSLQPVCQVS